MTYDEKEQFLEKMFITSVDGHYGNYRKNPVCGKKGLCCGMTTYIKQGEDSNNELQKNNLD